MERKREVEGGRERWREGGREGGRERKIERDGGHGECEREREIWRLRAREICGERERDMAKANEIGTSRVEKIDISHFPTCSM